MNAEFDLPFTSICMITYNHQNFIAEAIEGVLIQEVNFPFELIIANDASTDNTDSIINDFIKTHSKGNLIKYINQERNIGIMPNFIFALEHCKGKYIAMCEGDDYWTDKYKLQKQVDFLEANEDYAICYHEVYELEDGKLVLSKLKSAENEETYTIEDLAEYNFINTASAIFRNGLIKEFPSWFKHSPVGDYPLHMLNALHGKIKYFSEPMGVYRKHGGSTWSSKPKKYMYENLLIVLDNLKQEINGNVKIIIEKQQYNMLLNLSEEYKAANEEENYISTLARAFILNKSKMGNRKERKQIPGGVWENFKFLIKQIKTRLN